MKAKMYKLGKKNYKAYYKNAGKGFEVGFTYGAKSIFLGNFINKQEAEGWFEIMNHEIAKFSRKFWIGRDHAHAMAFYHKFMSNNLYKHYYDYLDKCFGKYSKSYHREYSRDVKTYNKMSRGRVVKENAPFMRRAS